MNAAIHDYNDDFNRGVIVYQPFLTTAPETAYPFVSGIVLSQSGINSSRVGQGEVTFTVTFNRDMDTTRQPQVSFGPDTPVTDYTIHPVNGGWQDPRTWTGTFNINPITGDGYQLIRIAGARAASDPWLVTGDDAGRFRFEIITSGTEAMNLQATGGEGRVDLMWTQDDFDLLAGYNVYRSDSRDGTYSRINPVIIPPDVKSFRDTNVQPGKPYFYKFTVVKSDMSESDFSNIASATPLDTIPPVITHTPVTSAANSLPLQIYADVTDNVKVTQVTLYHRKIGQTVYSSREMVKTTGNRYSATLEGSLITAPGLEYYVQATDGITPVRSGRADAPHRVNVTDRPEVTSASPNWGLTDGGTLVTVTGANFQSGASVTFGGAVAGSVIRISSSQLTCLTPPHLPGTVDVAVANPGGSPGTLLRGFTYRSAEVTVEAPDIDARHNALVDVPVSAGEVDGLLAAFIKLSFDSNVLSIRSVTTGALTAGFSIASNTGVPGEVTVALAGSTPVSGSGSLVRLEFLVTGAPGALSDLTLAEVSLNDGAIPVVLDSGSVRVKQLLNVSGRISYYMGGCGVPGVNVALVGNGYYGETTDSTGAYTLDNVPTGTYTLAVSKTDDVAGITAYDASLILQASVRLITLTARQTVAADVDRSGAVTPLDAAYVLQKAAELISLPFPGAGQVWAFEPASRRYDPLDVSLTNQDFTAILIGDVSGNWCGSVAEQRTKAPTDAPSLYIPKVSASPSGRVTLPVALTANSHPVYSADIVISYNPALLTAVNVEKAALTGGFSLAANLTRAGQIVIALAGATPVTADGELVSITFDVTGTAPNTAAVQVTSAGINESPATAQGGAIIIAANRTIAGATRLSDVLLAPAAYEGWQITVSGTYLGWEPGHGVPSVSRNDWLLQDGTVTIYVTGSSQDLTYPKDKGKPITIGGTVRIKNDMPFIEATRK